MKTNWSRELYAGKIGKTGKKGANEKVSKINRSLNLGINDK